MVRIKYILFGMLHVLFLHSAEKKTIRFNDCFDIKEVEVAGAPLFYAPVLGGRIDKAFVWSSLFSGMALEQPVGIRGCVGFVSGANKELVDRISKRVLCDIPQYEKDSAIFCDEGLLSEDYLSKALREEKAQTVNASQASSAVCLRLFRFRCSAEDRLWQFISPLELSMQDKDENKNSLPWLLPHSRADAADKEQHELDLLFNKPLIPAPDALGVLASLDCAKKVSLVDHFTALRQHAQEQCRDVDLSHHAPVLLLKEPIFADYLTQVFDVKE